MRASHGRRGTVVVAVEKPYEEGEAVAWWKEP